jgi:hypothetical protein
VHNLKTLIDLARTLNAGTMERNRENRKWK